MKKRLYRVEEGKKICGVCGGIAEYFDIDPTLVRLGAVVLALTPCNGILLYIIGACIIPEKSNIINADQ